MWQRVVEGPLPNVTQTPDQERLTRVFDAQARNVYSYALRHVGSSDPDDALSETFAVAWRRRDSLPTDPLAWLLVTARNIISDRYRADQRRATDGRPVGGRPLTILGPMTTYLRDFW